MLNYRFKEGSSKKTIVLLHGFMEDLSMWKDSFFPKELSLLAIDLPGHGDSELIEDIDNPSILSFAKSVKSLIELIISDNYHVVGHSLGGYVALELKKLDQKCEDLVLYHSNFWVDSEEKKRDRIRVADLVLRNKDLFISEAMPSLFYGYNRNSDPVQAYIALAKNMSGPALAYAALAMRNRADFTETCKSWNANLWFIHGEKDPLIPLEFVKELVLSSPFKFQLLEDAGHMSQVEAPEKVTELFHSIFSKLF